MIKISEYGEFRVSNELKELAIKVIDKREEIAHVDVDEVLFLIEYKTKPNAIARTYKLTNHPIQAFTDCKYAIVFYDSNTDYMSEKQLALLMLHELMHIPKTGDLLVNHNVQDFYEVLKIGSVDWSKPNVDVPDILGGEDTT
ncbi:MAG: hypothetical protein PWP27_201 [Clostridiales bacterium]|nr:hypothetical protein [Clostridiales bacterium]